MAASLAGRLLVAGPELTDPNFEHTVVMLLEHGDEGAMGVVLNRPSLTRVQEHLPAWGALAADPAFIFAGGPVSLSTAICLGTAHGPIEEEGWTPILGRVGALDLDADPASTARLVTGVRVFAG
ncbi:MAG: YqgE/AlgH family protein [Candidatus Dormibacteria bacterium]